MCKWGTDRQVEIVQRRHVGIDDCIADEIVWLNEQGVHTLNSCCGHGKAVSTAIIWPHSVARAREVGYEPTFPADTEPMIELKGALWVAPHRAGEATGAEARMRATLEDYAKSEIYGARARETLAALSTPPRPTAGVETAEALTESELDALAKQHLDIGCNSVSGHHQIFGWGEFYRALLASTPPRRRQPEAAAGLSEAITVAADDIEGRGCDYDCPRDCPAGMTCSLCGPEQKRHAGHVRQLRQAAALLAGRAGRE